MGAKHAMRFVNCSGFAYERLVGNCALSIYQYCYGHHYSEKIVIKPKSFCYFIPRYIQRATVLPNCVNKRVLAD